MASSAVRAMSGEMPSLPEVYGSVAVPTAGKPLRRFLAFLGPGYLVAVGYMDPGNWATDLAGGSAFGYTLLSVVLISNLMAILLQSLAARLGIATGRDLAQACRAHYSRPVNLSKFDSLEWMTAEEDLWAIPEYLVDIKHTPILRRSKRMYLDERSF